MFVLDPRLEQVKKVVESLITKTLLYTTECLVTNDNTLFMMVDNTLLYMVQLKNELPYPALGFSYAKFMSIIGDREVDFSKESIDILDNFIANKIFTIANRMMDNNPVVANIEDLKSEESFAKYLNIKSDDGMKYYRLPGIDPSKQYFIPVFTGFPNITSQDKLGITVYDTCDGFLTVHYNIYKKKISRDIKIAFRIINLTGN